eukprot:2280174-Prymnesium_polylepis.2
MGEDGARAALQYASLLQYNYMRLEKEHFNCMHSKLIVVENARNARKNIMYWIRHTFSPWDAEAKQLWTHVKVEIEKCSSICKDVEELLYLQGCIIHLDSIAVLIL